MCGVAGILNFRQRPVEKDELSAMTNRMIERGPDDDGFYVSGRVGFGFRRLSIIDVVGGHQPIANEDGELQLVLNGEIYNHIEIRNQLLARGHVFRTKSDAEVVLHLYEEKGVRSLEELNGMFAFALWDNRRNVLWIARDRLGIKPLFYNSTPDRFVFASDVRALRAICKTEIDPKAVLRYLALAYTPGTQTVWRGVRKLAPAHYLLVEGDGSIQAKQYWSVDKPRGTWQGSVAEATARLEDLLVDAVRLQMRSDVPVGVFLSGGLDSSTIVSFAAQLTCDPLRTFTINFLGKQSNDGKFARSVAERYATSHTQLEMSETDAVQGMDELLFRMDEPLADSAVLPAYLLSSVAQKQGIKVLLNGAGGDEIFGGYRRHWPPRFGSPSWVAEALPISLRRFAAGAWSLFQPDRAVRASDPVFAWASTVSGVNLHACRLLLRDPNTYKEVTQTLDEEYAGLVDTCQTKDFPYARMMMDVQTYLPHDVLSLTDKATMAASVEGRVPLLDHRLVEFAFSLPPSMNLFGGKAKGLLKKVMASRLPTALLLREKEGFNAPVSEWMQQAGALDIGDELLHHRTAILDELINPSVLEMLISNPKQRRLAAETLFSLFVFNRWYRAQKVS